MELLKCSTFSSCEFVELGVVDLYLVPCRITNGAPSLCLYRSSKLESDQFPHIIPSVNTSPEVSLILGYEGCLNLESLRICNATG